MLKSLDSILLFVKDPAQSAEFYRQIGFDVTDTDQNKTMATLGGFRVQLYDKEKVHFKNDTTIEPKGAGVFIYVRVENIDAYHKTLLEKGLQPSSEPHDWPWGNREFAIKDPDGYKLVFYTPLT